MSDSGIRYGVRLKSARRYYYRGRIYERGQEYAVSRELRDHLFGSGYFEDILIDDPGPQPIAVGGQKEEPKVVDVNNPRGLVNLDGGGRIGETVAPPPEPEPSGYTTPQPVKRKRGRPRKAQSATAKQV